MTRGVTKHIAIEATIGLPIVQPKLPPPPPPPPPSSPAKLDITDNKTNAMISSTKAAPFKTWAILVASKPCPADLRTKKVVPSEVEASAEPAVKAWIGG